jgi:segregation and condensation protein A
VTNAARLDATSSENPVDAGWQDPPRSAAPTDAPILSAEGFEGPLDWLLEMARAQKIDVAKLPIAALIQSFVTALEAAFSQPDGRAPSLPRWGDWLVMAATLTQLRSRLLLPADAPEAKAALSEAEALRRQLVGREEMRAAADWLERRPQLGQEVFARGQSEGRATSRGGDITDLLRACLKLLQVPVELAAIYRPRPPAFWRVSQAIARIEAMLLEQPEGVGFTAFLPAIAADVPNRERQCRAAVASTLVAGLELARQGGVGLGQEVDWGEISVKAKTTS